MITTSTPRSRPRATASNATAPGSEPSGPVTISQPARSAHCVELLDGGGAERVGRAEQDRLAELALQVPGELADRGRLARAVDADGHDHRRLVAQVDVVVAGAGDAGQQLDEALLQRGAALDLARGRLLLELADDARGRPRADVGHDQRLLEALPRLLVERVEQRGLDLGGQRLARLGQVLAQALEEPAAALRLLGVVGRGRRGARAVVAGQEEVAPVSGHGARR